MKEKKIAILKLFFYFFLAVLSFEAGIQISDYFINKNNNSKSNIINTAYCLTLNDYIIKLSNKNMETIERKSMLYLVKGLLQSKKNTFLKTCPDIYHKALKFYQDKSDK